MNTKNQRYDSAPRRQNTRDAPVSLLNEAQRFEFMNILRSHNPSPQPELKFRNPFELLCAVLLSAQCTDAAVNKATPALFAAAPDAQALCALSTEQIASYIRSLGLWQAKSRYLKELAVTLSRDFKGAVPADFDLLTSLPGVGPKTALVVLNVAFGRDTIAVDTHIFRLCQRSGLCLGKNALQVQQRLPALIDDEFKRHAHHWLLLHGRYVCKARTPDCAHCAVKSLCVTGSGRTAHS